MEVVRWAEKNKKVCVCNGHL